MTVAKTLGKSVEEVTQFSVLELQLWSAYFKIERDEQRKVMDGSGGKHKNRTRRR
jgi:hypothetical protein